MPPEGKSLNGAKLARIAILGLAAVSLLAAIELLPMPRDTLLWRTLFNAGHAPLFGVFALVVLGFARTLRPGRRPAGPYVLAFGAAVVAGGLTELYQYFGPRDANLIDFARDGAGAAAFLLLAWAIEGARARRRYMRRLAAAVALGLLALVGVPVLMVARAYVQRASEFPTLCRFDSGWERSFLVTRLAGFHFTAVPRRWTDAPSTTVGRVNFSGWRYPSLTLLEVEENWEGHETLVFSAFALKPIDLTVRLEELGHRPRPEDRFDTTVRLEPGSTTVRIPLDELRSVEGRRPDLGRMCHVTWFLPFPEPTVLYLDELRLE